jgi:hypothetical protein
VMGNTREEPRQRPHIGRNRDEPVGRPHRSYVDMSLGYQPSQSTQHSGQTLEEPHETMREDDQVNSFESSRDDISGLSDLEDFGEGNFSPNPSDDDDLSGVYSDSFEPEHRSDEERSGRVSPPAVMTLDHTRTNAVYVNDEGQSHLFNDDDKGAYEQMRDNAIFSKEEAQLTPTQMTMARLSQHDLHADARYMQENLGEQDYQAYLHQRCFLISALTRAREGLADVDVVGDIRRSDRNTKAQALLGLWTLEKHAREAAESERARRSVLRDPSRPGATYTERTRGPTMIVHLDDVGAAYTAKEAKKLMEKFRQSTEYTTASLHKGDVISYSSVYKCWESWSKFSVFWPICNFNTASANKSAK